MRVLTDAEWERLSNCSMLSQTIYLFVLREAAGEVGGSTVEISQAEISWELERRGDWVSRDRLTKALNELVRCELVEKVQRRPVQVYRLPWIWPTNLTVGVVSSESIEGAV